MLRDCATREDARVMRSEGGSIVRRGRRDVRDCSIERFISDAYLI